MKPFFTDAEILEFYQNTLVPEAPVRQHVEQLADRISRLESALKSIEREYGDKSAGLKARAALGDK